MQIFCHLQKQSNPSRQIAREMQIWEDKITRDMTELSKQTIVCRHFDFAVVVLIQMVNIQIVVVVLVEMVDNTFEHHLLS